ncbi:MAG TPA: glycerate kinase [Janthinobacterium sp.]|jgi:glycerate kinase|nr:glycerate kinase [Janthinobacterium sp.]
MTTSTNRIAGSTLRVLVAPDSFKGSMDAIEVARHLSAGIRRAVPSAQVQQVPIADGGEGTAEAIAAALDGVWQQHTVTDGNGVPRGVPVALCDSPAMGRFAVFDVARIVGLPDAVAAPEQRTTAGIGELIGQLHAQGVATIVIGLGGSSTTDAGAGLLGALAYEFEDAEGKPLQPRFDNLAQIRQIRRRADTAWLAGTRLIALTDVTSPLAGPQGAAMIFGRQKGFQDLEQADARLAGFAAAFESAFPELAQGVAGMPGAGAAGGLGFGLALLGAKLHEGAAFICETSGLTEDIAGYDWVITGEGRSDLQTMMGKGPAAVAALARKHAVPVSLVSGAVEACAELDAAFDGCFSIVPGPQTLAWAMANTGALLEQAAYQLTRLFVSTRRG